MVQTRNNPETCMNAKGIISPANAIAPLRSTLALQSQIKRENFPKEIKFGRTLTHREITCGTVRNVAREDFSRNALNAWLEKYLGSEHKSLEDHIVKRPEVLSVLTEHREFTEEESGSFIRALTMKVTLLVGEYLYPIRWAIRLYLTNPDHYKDILRPRNFPSDDNLSDEQITEFIKKNIGALDFDVFIKNLGIKPEDITAYRASLKKQ